MNSSQAKKTPLSEILNQLGHQPHHQHGGELLYFSPLRVESVPSFSVNVERNIYNDFGQGGGNVLDFIMAYYGINDISSALRQLENLMGQQRIAPVEPVAVVQTTISSLEIRKIASLQNRALTKYLKQRGISSATARPYVKEIYYTRNNKNYFSLAFVNESGGYELRNSYFKGVYGTKDITIIKRKNLLAHSIGEEEIEAVTVFEGFIDFLSALTYRSSWTSQRM